MYKTQADDTPRTLRADYLPLTKKKFIFLLDEYKSELMVNVTHQN